MHCYLLTVHDNRKRPTFVLNSVDTVFYLIGFVTSHNKIIKFAANKKFTDKTPIHVRKVCLWPAISTTNITQSIIAAVANLQTIFLISCLVATQPVSVDSSTVQQPTVQTAISVV